MLISHKIGYYFIILNFLCILSSLFKKNKNNPLHSFFLIAKYGSEWFMRPATIFLAKLMLVSNRW